MTELPHVAGVATRSEPDVVRRDGGRGRRASSTVARRTSARRASTRSRPTAPPRRRAVPTTATATCSWSSTAGARCAPTSTTSRWSSRSSPQRGLTFGLHLVAGAARWADFRAAITRRLRHPARAAPRRPDRLRDRPQARRSSCPTGRPGRGLVAAQAALPGRPAAHRRRRRRARARRRGRGPRRAVAAGVAAARRAPSCGCCPSGSTWRRRARAGRAGPGLEPADCLPRRRREGPRPGRARHRPRSRTCSSSATAARARARCCAPTPTR